MEDLRLPNQILTRTPAGRRKTGRPKKSWRKGIDKEMREREREMAIGSQSRKDEGPDTATTSCTLSTNFNMFLYPEVY